MTVFNAKRASRTHAHTVTTLLLSLKQYVRLLVLVRRGLGVGWGLLEGQVRPPLSLQMSNDTLNHSNPPQPQRFTTMMMMGETQSRWQLRRQAPVLGSRGTVPMKTMGRPSTPCVGSCVLSLDEDACTDINSPCLLLVTTTQHTQHPTSWWKPLLHNLNVWNVEAAKGVTSENRCMVLVPRWCGGYGIVCILRYSCEHPGYGGLVWVWCMRVKVSSTNPTCECTLILFADTMKRNFQEVDDDDCHPHWLIHDTKEVQHWRRPSPVSCPSMVKTSRKTSASIECFWTFYFTNFVFLIFTGNMISAISKH